QEGGRRWTALLGVTLGMSWLAGGPQATTFLVYAWASLLFGLLVTTPPRLWIRSGFAFGIALGLGTLAGMIQLLPARELAGVGALLGWVRAGESRLRAGRAPLLSPALGALVVALSTLGIESWPGQLPYGAEQAREYHRQDAAYATLAELQGDARIWFAANFVVRGFPPRLATVHGVRSFQDVEPLYLARQRDYLTFLFGGRGSPLDWIRVDTKELVSRARLLDLASVRYVVVPYGGLADA